MAEKAVKKKRKSTIIIVILLIAALIAAMVSGFMVLWELVIQPSINNGINEEIRTTAQLSTEKKSQKGSGTTSEKDTSPRYDFDALRKVNGDIVGWIQIPNTVVDYPVLQSAKDDPEYYLYRTYKKEDSKYGSIFVNSAATVTGKNLSRAWVLYGHHMNDGQMFADILKFADLEFYKKTPTFAFDTYEKRGDWKVISVFRTNTRKSQGEPFQYNYSDFNSDEKFLDFVHQLMIRSIIKTDVKVNENDQIVLLSTCSYEMPDFRTVVVARRVRDGETTKVDVKNASYAENPLYPQGWYDQNGGTRPSYPETFKEAKKAGLTDWYDGKK